MLEFLVVSIVVSFLAGAGVGTFVLATRIGVIVAAVVTHTHQELAEVEAKTKELIAAGVTKLEEIKKAL